MRRLLIFQIPSVLLLGMALGCTNANSSFKAGMDRETAAHEVSSGLRGEDNALPVEIGKVGLRCEVQNPDGTKAKMPIDAEHSVSHVVAQKAGYVTVTREGKGLWTVALTDKGKAALEKQPKDFLPDLTNKDDRNTLSGCDFHEVAFKIASPELIRVTGVTADEKTPKVDFFYKWHTTELGDMLRADGSVFTQLDPLQKAEMMRAVDALVYRAPIPLPPPDRIESGSATFTRYDDGWRMR